MNYFEMFRQVTPFTEPLIALFTLERLEFEMDHIDVSA